MELVFEQCEDGGYIGNVDYKEAARRMGYPHIAVLDWTSSLGDWDFVVSKEGDFWHIMIQRNRHPRAGFKWDVIDTPEFVGDEQLVLGEAEAFFYL